LKKVKKYDNVVKRVKTLPIVKTNNPFV